ncbi:hypothetical protein pb186bvf_012861 [Paramecium bursaria]
MKSILFFIINIIILLYGNITQLLNEIEHQLQRLNQLERKYSNKISQNKIICFIIILHIINELLKILLIIIKKMFIYWWLLSSFSWNACLKEAKLRINEFYILLLIHSLSTITVSSNCYDTTISFQYYRQQNIIILQYLQGKGDKLVCIQR